MKVAKGVEIFESVMERLGQKSNIYPTLIYDENIKILADAGLVTSVPDIEKGMSELGFSINDLDMVIVSHQDLDHIGGLPKLVEKSNGKLKVCTHLEEKPFVQGEKTFARLKPENVQGLMQKMPENMKSEVIKLVQEAKSYKGVVVNQTLEDGEVLPYCGGITVIHTPGHTAGHICLYLNESKTLIAGDELDLIDGKLYGPKPGLSADEEQAIESIKKLTNYDIETVICYHGGIYKGNVNERIKEIIEESAKIEKKPKQEGPFLQGPSVQSIAGEHWSKIKFAEDILTDALVKHVLGLCYCNMADAGEIFEAIALLDKENKRENDWKDAWKTIAERVQERAEKYESAGKNISASTAYLRAATYWRVSTMYFEHVNDEDMKKFTKISFDCYEKYLQLSDYPGKYIEIPYENTYLPGHFYCSPKAKEKAPILIVTPGRDTWAEDTRWIVNGAIQRGIHCLTYDGPGQGYALRLQDLKFRNDWENVLGPVIDYVEKNIPEVDNSKIICMGTSFGGFLLPRVAAFDKRIKLCIADPGSSSWGNAIIPRLQMLQNMPKEIRPKFMNIMVEDYAWKHGVSEENIIEELKKYDNTDVIDKITCKVLVLDGTAETSPGAALKFYEMLKCPKDYILFDENTTAQCHTQMGGYATATEYIFNWIEDNI